VKVLIINIDSKMPNIALKKIEKYHLNRGDSVQWDFSLAKYSVDKIYVSCVFTKNRNKCEEYSILDHAVIGGSGWDIKSKLSDEIEAIKPHINYGFTSRGCIRNCGFCIVPEKEGMVHPVGDLLDVWDGKSRKVTLLDNNILALPDHFRLICKQARNNNIRIDFNQGLDHRLLNNDIAEELKSVSIKHRRFAFDHPSYFYSVDKAIDILNHNELFYNMWYVLVGFNTSFQDDIFRLNYLRARKQRAYVMRYRNDRRFIPLSEWANRHDMFNAVSFEKFLIMNKNGLYKDILKEL